MPAPLPLLLPVAAVAAMLLEPLVWQQQQQWQVRQAQQGSAVLAASVPLLP
jgi:hypothetical protein